MTPTTATTTTPLVLIAAARETSLASVLGASGYAIAQPRTGALALERARKTRPDLVILEADLPDMSGIDACWLLRSDPHIGRNVPILILTRGLPTPEQRVTALRAGAWDFVRYPGDVDELSLKLETYLQAKRNIDVALADGLVDPATGLHTRSGLARRARELGALMARHHGALACVVVELASAPLDARTGTLVAQAARVSDVVGALGSTAFAVLAPLTDHTGAVKLAERLASALREGVGEDSAAGPAVRVGYDAVANLTYSPIDPANLLARAAGAVRNGTPEPGYPWLRRSEAVPPPLEQDLRTARTTPPGLVLNTPRRVGP
ncbi:MAG: response regulator [Gemmatimonadales bacterium]